MFSKGEFQIVLEDVVYLHCKLVFMQHFLSIVVEPCNFLSILDLVFMVSKGLPPQTSTPTNHLLLWSTFVVLLELPQI